MNSSDKENLIKSDRRTKAQLLKTLRNANDILDQQKKELVTLHKEFDKANAKIIELTAQQFKSVSVRDELRQSQTALNDMTRQVEQLKEEVEKLERTHKKDQEEKNNLLSQLQTSSKDQPAAGDEELQEELAQAVAQEQSLKGKIKDLESKNEQLAKQIADLQKTEETVPENTPIGKAAFRIDLYPRQGYYQGKVEHLITKEKKAFSGLDIKAIADFIDRHLPQLEESFVTAGSVSSEPTGEPLVESEPFSTAGEKPLAVSEPVTSIPANSPVETQKPGLKIGNIRKFTLVQDEKVHKEKSIPQNQIFQVALTVDPLESIVDKNVPSPYKISVFGKRLGGGFKQILGKTSGQITTAGEVTANVHCVPLPAGIYRFMAFGTINIKNDGQESTVLFQENSIFNVA